MAESHGNFWVRRNAAISSLPRRFRVCGVFSLAFFCWVIQPALRTRHPPQGLSLTARPSFARCFQQPAPCLWHSELLSAALRLLGWLRSRFVRGNAIHRDPRALSGSRSCSRCRSSTKALGQVLSAGLHLRKGSPRRSRALPAHGLPRTKSSSPPTRGLQPSSAAPAAASAHAATPLRTPRLQTLLCEHTAGSPSREATPELSGHSIYESSPSYQRSKGWSLPGGHAVARERRGAPGEPVPIPALVLGKGREPRDQRTELPVPTSFTH